MNYFENIRTSFSSATAVMVAATLLALALLFGPSFDATANQGSDLDGGTYATQADGWLANNGAGNGQGDPSGG